MKIYIKPILEISKAIPLSFICASELTRHDQLGNGQLDNTGFFDDMDDNFINSGESLWDNKDEEK